MPSVFLRDGGYVVKWRDAAGLWRTKRTTCDTKAEARRLAADLERQAERQSLGLEARPTDTSMTLAELCEGWLLHRQGRHASREADRARLGKHVFAHPLGRAPLSRVTTEALEQLLSDMGRAGAAPASVNRIRSSLHAAFERARKAKLWTGPNPVSDVEPRRVPKRAYATLRAEEVALLLPHVEERWRNFFAAALWTGMRKGELCGLLKTDVDLEGRTLIVARSYDHDTTKGGHADAVPIAEPLVPYLQDAIARSPSKWVFPSSDGSMRTEECDPQKVLRTALGRAGIVDGFQHVCRRCTSKVKRGELPPKAECSWLHPDDAPRRCERCSMKLWPVATPRPLRFHDLRHTTATLLLRAGVDPHRVQRILRHSDIRTTLGTYGHLTVEDLRGAMATLPEGPPLPEAPSMPLQRAASDALGAPVVRNQVPEKTSARNRSKFSNDSGPLPLWAHQVSNLGPLPCERPQSSSDALAAGGTGAQASDRTGRGAGRGGDPLAPGGSVATRFGAPVVRTKGALGAVGGGLERLLTVREVAEHLAVSTATVYALCARGELEHVRVSNSIRVRQADLESFISRRPEAGAVR